MSDLIRPHGGLNEPMLRTVPEAETADFLRLSGDAESEQKEWHNSSEN